MKEPSLLWRRNKGHQLMVAKWPYVRPCLKQHICIEIGSPSRCCFCQKKFSARADIHSDGNIKIWQRKQPCAGCTMIKRQGSRSCRSPSRTEQQGNEMDSVMYGTELRVAPNSECAVLVSNVIAVFWALAVSLSLHAGAAGQIASLDSEIARGSGAQPCGGYRYFWPCPHFCDLCSVFLIPYPPKHAQELKHILSSKMLFNKVWSCDMKHDVSRCEITDIVWEYYGAAWLQLATCVWIIMQKSARLACPHIPSDH